MSISIRSLGKTLAVGTVSTLLLVVPTLAQDAKGEFTLSKEVRWGNTKLKPGKYSYSLEHHASEILMLRSSDDNDGYLMMARSVGRAQPPATDSLLLSKKGNEWVVSSLIVHDLDEELFFSTPAPVASEANATRVASISKP